MSKMKAPSPQLPVVEELRFKSDASELCVIINRRMQFLRVIDFRAGALPNKRLFIQSVAKREGIEKVLLLVEKDEVSSWLRVGFVREGTIPGFYQRSDGHLVGCVIGEKDDHSDEGAKLAEKTINTAKRNLREIPDEIDFVTVEEIDEVEALEARNELWKKQVGLSGFDPFGRNAERNFVMATPKKGKPTYLSAEIQDWFGHALIELLRGPQENLDVFAVTAGLRKLSADLLKRGIVSAFAFAPSNDLGLATAYTAAGFRKTGLLAKGIRVGDTRKDAILWTRKLANPGGEEE